MSPRSPTDRDGPKQPLRLLHLHATCRNLGDALIVRTIRTLASETFPHREVQFVDVSLDRDPEGQRGAIGFLPLYHYHRPRWWGRTLAALRDADAVVIGGGELLSGGLEFLGFALLGWARGIPVVYPGIGLDLGNAARLSRYYTRVVVRLGRFFVARDREAADQLRRFGVPVGSIEVAPDVALAFPAPMVGHRPRSEPPRVGVSLRPEHDRAFPVGDAELQAVARLLDRMVESQGVTIVLFALHPLDPEPAPGGLGMSDEQVLEAMVRHMRHPEAVMRYPGPVDPEAVLQAFRQLRGLVAMRLHATILGLKAGLLPLAIEYAPKIRRTLEHIGLGDRVVRFAELDRQDMMPRILESGDPPALESIAREARRHVELLVEPITARRRPTFLLRLPLLVLALSFHWVLMLYGATPPLSRILGLRRSTQPAA